MIGERCLKKYCLPSLSINEELKRFVDVLKIVEMHPKFEIFMSDLTKSRNPLYSSSLEDLKRKAEWATSYGLDLYNRNVEITDEVRAQFNADFKAEFGDDNEK